MPVPKHTPEQDLAARVDQTGRLPIPSLFLTPLPKKIVSAFPEMADWLALNNRRIADWLKTMNTIR
jgi:hypothetical protein